MSNNLANVVPTILKYGALALREYAIMPRVINTDYGTEVAQKGNTINVTIPSAKTAANVVPGTPQSSGTDVGPTTFPIALSNWKEAGFTLSDKELKEMDDKQVLAGEASEALKALVNAVDQSIIANYKKIFRYCGTAGSQATDVDSIIAARQKLNNNLAPKDPRALIVDSVTEANYLKLALFTSKADSDTDAQISGELGRRFGFLIANDQNIESNTFTCGTRSGYKVDSASVAIGDSSVNVDTGTGTYLIGDIFTVAGDSQFYVVTANELTGGNDKTLSFYPPAKVAWSNDADITFYNTAGQQNLGFHRDCFSLASRPLDTPDGLGVISSSIVDPISGLALRLEVSRPHKQTRWSWDILWGTACTRPELGVRQVAS